MRNSSLNDIQDYSLELEDFIEDMKCDTQIDLTNHNSDKNKKCGDQDVIRSLQRNSVCFTHFHKMANYTKRDTTSCRMFGVCGQLELRSFLKAL